MKKIERIITVLSSLLAGISALCIALMMLHIFWDVVLKYAINQPVIGTAEAVSHYYMVGAVFLPLALAEIRNAGISVTLFYDMMGGRLRRVMMLGAYIGQIVFFAILTYQSGIDALESFHKFEMIEGQVIMYIWPASFFLPLGLGVATIVSILRFLQVLFSSAWEQVIESSG